MANIVDARGRSCPEPVILTKNAIDAGNDNLKVLVDTHVAVENITRFVENKGFKVEVEEKSDEFELNIKK
jgi:TusA-related sulfurtransferase